MVHEIFHPVVMVMGEKVFLRHNNDAEFFRNQPEKKVISCKLMRMIRGHIVFFFFFLERSHVSPDEKSLIDHSDLQTVPSS